MKPHTRVAALGFALAAVVTGCDFAARTGIVRDDMRVLTDAQEVVANAQLNHGDLTVQASADRADTTYATGQPIVLSVRVNKDAHVAVLRVLANGQTTLLFPNRAHKADTQANRVTLVPDPHDGLTAAVGKPGVVLFEVIASTSGDSWLFKRTPDKDADFAELGVTTHTIAKDIVDSLKVGKGPDTAATLVTVRVR